MDHQKSALNEPERMAQLPMKPTLALALLGGPAVQGTHLIISLRA
jgi:hypothetical protein